MYAFCMHKHMYDLVHLFVLNAPAHMLFAPCTYSPNAIVLDKTNGFATGDMYTATIMIPATASK